jgi:subtilisin family serine protease
MKKDFQRGLLALLSTLALSACGANQEVVSNFKETKDSCGGSALPQQFMVRNKDGSTEAVRADSEETFRQGYLKEHADRIEYAEHDFVVAHSLPVHTEAAGNASQVADNWGVMKVDADKLWAQNVRGAGITVAVIDSGMDLTHPQLANQVAANSGEQGTDTQGHNKATNGIDDDENGYVDDVAGYDFVANQPLKGDYQYHGTHVAGIVLAAHQDTVAKSASYVQGVAPGAKVLPLAFLDAEGSGLMSDGVRAIQYAVARGARVINASWGGTQCSQTLRDEINGLASKNVFFIAAAGNDSSNVDSFMEYPASLNLAAQITVGATGDHDYMAQYSNFGAKAVHIFAPGSNIVSTLPNGSMGFLSGTSMATPFVTGAVALLISAVPDATIPQVRSALYASAVHNAQYIAASQGRMDLANALTELHRIVGH